MFRAATDLKRLTRKEQKDNVGVVRARTFVELYAIWCHAQFCVWIALEKSTPTGKTKEIERDAGRKKCDTLTALYVRDIRRIRLGIALSASTAIDRVISNEI